MSITGSLASALSGLTASARAAEIISSNIANATTPGYGRREISTSARVVGHTGQGVKVDGVTRHSDLVLLGDRRRSDAALAEHQSKTRFHSAVENALGTVNSATSLASRIAALDTSLLQSASMPSSEVRLSGVLDSARGLASHIVAASKAIQTERTLADSRIAADVSKLNQALAQVHDINIGIRSARFSGGEFAALVDQRQRIIDGIAGIVPIRQLERDDGQIALFAVGGATLLEGQPAVFGFEATRTITADMSLTAGSLSGLTLQGQALPIGVADSLISGGSLAANFAIRDSLAPDAQAKLDGFARDLIERFADPAVDPTLAPGDAGIFTDDGGAFLPPNEPGLGERIKINAAIDPRQGGALWRIRDGIGATLPGASDNASHLVAMQQALTQSRPPSSSQFSSAPRSLAAFQSDLLSGFAANRLAAEADTTYAAARAEALTQEELAQGVDTDQEMQSLLLIEKVYGANARVIQAVSDMIDTLLGL